MAAELSASAKKKETREVSPPSESKNEADGSSDSNEMKEPDKISSHTTSNVNTNDLIDKLAQIKSQGNKLFKSKDYNGAILEYSQGIDEYDDLMDKHHTTLTRELQMIIGAMLNNRGFCYFRLELFNATIDDCTRAIKFKFFKGYYRRGCAHAAMGKWSKAKKDFQRAQNKFPSSKEIKKMLKEATAAHRFAKFAKAIESDEEEVEKIKEAMHSLQFDAYEHPDEKTYKGPRYDKIDDIDEKWVVQMQKFHKDGGTLHVKYAVGIVQRALKIFSNHSNVVFYNLHEDNGKSASSMADKKDKDDDDETEERLDDEKSRSTMDLAQGMGLKEDGSNDGSSRDKAWINDHPQATHITVCGDVHGQLYDYLHIFELNGYPSKSNPYLFNGDFVDRGSWSVEVILSLLAWKCVLGHDFMMTRGNHESINMNTMYGFTGEVEHKYSKKFFPLFTELFNNLPLAYILGGRVFVCHGGLFKEDGVTIERIQMIDRKCQPTDGNINPPDQAEVMADMLWSDPQEMPGLAPSKRGGGTMFGPDITKKFLETNGLELVIRSHEVQKDGWSRTHNGQLITIFSAPNYCDSMGNKGAYIHLDGANNYEPSFFEFSEQPHPPIAPMKYAGFNMANFFR